MTLPTDSTQNQEQKANTEQKNDKEYNFRALEAKFQRQLEQERNARLEAEKRIQEISQQRSFHKDEDEDDDEPYVDRKKLNKTLQKFGEQSKQQTQSEIEKAVQKALSEERKQNWIRANPDFYEVLQHADKFAEKDPDLAESILEMPDGFERQKLVYKNIKAFGLHKPPQPQSTVQDKIDANRRSPYYQPTGISNAPYNSSVGDFSRSGQENAYKKMQELKKSLRI